MSWLPRAEEKLKSMGPVGAEARNVRIQIEEMKVVTFCFLNSSIQYRLKAKRNKSSFLFFKTLQLFCSSISLCNISPLCSPDGATFELDFPGKCLFSAYQYL